MRSLQLSGRRLRQESSDSGVVFAYLNKPPLSVRVAQRKAAARRSERFWVGEGLSVDELEVAGATGKKVIKFLRLAGIPTRIQMKI